MSPLPSSSSDGPSPPSLHRPNLGDLGQDSSERDLWAFDEELNSEDESVEELPQKSGPQIPPPRERTPEQIDEDLVESQAAEPPASEEEQPVVNVSDKSRLKGKPLGMPVSRTTPVDTFDDLEAWEDSPAGTEIAELREVSVIEPEATSGPSETEPNPEIDPETGKVSDRESDGPTLADSAVAEPKNQQVNPKWSKIERAGMIVLFLLLIGGGAATFLISLNRLPTESERMKANDFPIAGSLVTIQSATSYWRVPITDGATPDTFRMGTELLPVLELSVKGGPAALRVVFRNHDREFVGDVVTRTIREAGIIEIPATAGFDDLGMHAAYRTGETKPWVIEVSEAASSDVRGSQFKKLFEMNISTDRR